MFEPQTEVGKPVYPRFVDAHYQKPLKQNSGLSGFKPYSPLANGLHYNTFSTPQKEWAPVRSNVRLIGFHYIEHH